MTIIWFLMPRCTALGAAGAHRGAGPLRREQIDALLEKLRDPALARQLGLPEKGKTIALQLVSAAQSW